MFGQMTLTHTSVLCGIKPVKSLEKKTLLVVASRPWFIAKPPENVPESNNQSSVGGNKEVNCQLGGASRLMVR